MKYLEKHNVLPGILVTTYEILPFLKTMKIKVADQFVILGVDVANLIFAEK
jgi:hypothetical protein